MNVRDYKLFAPDNYYHIYNRGNAKQNIFLDNQDFNFFISKLKQNLMPNDEDKTRMILLPPNSFSIINYCLMPNHFHILLKQNIEIPTSKLLSKLCTSYSKYFNKKYDRVGHVFQDQFKQVLIDGNSYLVWLSAYIHQNPKVAGLVSKPEDYKWSSYGEFVKGDNGLCDKEIITSQFKSTNDYKKFVESSFEIIKNKKDLEDLLLD